MNEPHVVVDLIHREWGSASVFEPGVLPDLPRTLGQDDTLGFEDLLGPFDPVAAMIRRAIVGVHAIRCIVSGHDRRIASIVEADPMIQGDADVPQAPLVPPFTKKRQFAKPARPRTPGIAVIPSGSASPIPKIATGGTGPSSSRAARK